MNKDDVLRICRESERELERAAVRNWAIQVSIVLALVLGLLAYWFA